MQTLIGHRFQKFNTTGAMGRVEDVTYIKCFWPWLDVPTKLPAHLGD